MRLAAVGGASRHCVDYPLCAEVVTERIHRFCICISAARAGECPHTLRSARRRSRNLARVPVMTECIDIIVIISVPAACAGISRKAVRRAGWIGHDSVVCMTKCIDHCFIDVHFATGTVPRLTAFYSTGRLDIHRPFHAEIVTKRINFFCSCFTTARTGKRPQATFCTGRFGCYFSLIPCMSECIHEIIIISVPATCAGISRKAIRRAGWIGHDSVVCMTKCIDHCFIYVHFATETVSRFAAFFGTGRLNIHRPFHAKIMTKWINCFCSCFITARTGKRPQATFCTGRFGCYFALIPGMSKCIHEIIIISVAAACTGIS